MTRNGKKLNMFGSLALVVISFAFVLYSTDSKAQLFASVRKSQSPSNIKTAGKAIRYAAGINLEAEATPLNVSINGPYEEIKPRLTPCGNRLYFSRSFHPGNIAGAQDAEDIWYSEYDKESGIWSEPIHMSGELNNAGPNYINNVSVTGDTIILGNQYLKRGKMRAGLSYSVNNNGQWSAPLPIEIQGDYNVSEHSNSFVSLQNGIIIRAVQRAESIGERDLFVSFWDGEKSSEPINMGQVINTQFEESSPYLAADNKTLYFASKGHNGHGGFDIYVTKRLDESWTNWSQPENLGPAVNGPMDDEFFSITHCGNFAIFSKQVSIHNVDIFRISMDELFNKPEPNKNHHIDTENMAVAKL